MPQKRKYHKQSGGEAPKGWGAKTPRPQIANCLVNTTSASSCGHAQRQVSAKNLNALHAATGAHGGGRRRRGGDTCATAPGVPAVAPTYASGSSNQMSPNGNQNIANSLKLAAVQQANASQDGTQGWAKVDNNKKGGGSALGNFVENLNNMSGGYASGSGSKRHRFGSGRRRRRTRRRRRRRTRRNTRKRKSKRRRKMRRKSRKKRGGTVNFRLTPHIIETTVKGTVRDMSGGRKKQTRKR